MFYNLVADLLFWGTLQAKCFSYHNMVAFAVAYVCFCGLCCKIMLVTQLKYNWNKTVKQITFRVNDIVLFQSSHNT